MYVKSNQIVILSFHHKSRCFRRKTLKNMIDQAGWTEQYLINLISRAKCKSKT
jgi:hypothetical protein